MGTLLSHTDTRNGMVSDGGDIEYAKDCEKEIKVHSAESEIQSDPVALESASESLRLHLNDQLPVPVVSQVCFTKAGSGKLDVVVFTTKKISASTRRLLVSCIRDVESDFFGKVRIKVGT